MQEPKITVIGSINMDIVTELGEIPRNGETLFGDNIFMNPGGKGANQAIAAHKLGAKVNLIGRVGNDYFGENIIKYFKEMKLSTSNIGFKSNVSTGAANVLIMNHDNRIIVSSGANIHVLPDFLENYKKSILDSDLVISQLEIPLESIEWMSQLCSENDIPFILNPAPARNLPASVLRNCSYITPNEKERTLFNDKDKKYYDKKIITTLGKKGVEYKGEFFSSLAVEVKDTTGAGDTFNGALAYFYARSKDIRYSIKMSNIAASFTVEKLGAQQGMPGYQQVMERSATYNKKVSEYEV